MPRKPKAPKPVKMSKEDEARAELQDIVDNKLVVGIGYMQSVLSKDDIQESDVYAVVGKHLDPTDEKVVVIRPVSQVALSAAREVVAIGDGEPKLAVVYNQTQVSAEVIKGLIEDLEDSGVSTVLVGVLSHAKHLPIR